MQQSSRINKDWDKQQVFQTATEIFKELHGDLPLNRACLHMTKIVLDVLEVDTDLRAIVQAGSMNWEIVPPEKDDGVMGTHFSFEWGMTPFFTYNPDSTVLPEMHVWVAIPSRQEILDFCVSSFPSVVKKLGLEWLSPPPPPYLWSHIKQLPRGCYYTANREATLLAMRIIGTL